MNTNPTASSSPMHLRINEAEFNALYPDLKGLYKRFNEPPPADITKLEFEKRYLSSKLWRLNNVYTIVDKYGNATIFRMNKAQHKVYAASRQHPRLIILKSRQQGISTLWLVSFFDDAIFASNYNIGLMAQGTDEAATLLERVKLLWSNLDPDIKNFANVAAGKDNSKEVSFSNGSKMFIRVSFRSATLQRLHVSEFGKIANAYPKRAKEVKTGSLQALAKGNTGVIESTAEGRNDFKTMWDGAVIAFESGQLAPKDFRPVFLSWLDDPDCTLDVYQTADNDALEYFKQIEFLTKITITQEQRNFWISQRRELGGDIFQEYPATPEEAFAASRDGTYYSRIFNESCVRKGGIVKDLYDPNLDTDLYFDLGVDDYTVMCWVQWYRGQYRIVKEYWNNGYDIEHYIDEAMQAGIPVREAVFPHDVKVRQLASGSSHGSRAKTRYMIINEYLKFHELKWRTRIIAKSNIADGIEAVRRMIPQMKIDASCTYMIDCFNNYSKEWDDKLQVWKKTPVHDEFSHGADTARQIAVGHSERGESSMAIPDTYKGASQDFEV